MREEKYIIDKWFIFLFSLSRRIGCRFDRVLGRSLKYSLRKFNHRARCSVMWFSFAGFGLNLPLVCDASVPLDSRTALWSETRRVKTGVHEEEGKDMYTFSATCTVASVIWVSFSGFCSLLSALNPKP